MPIIIAAGINLGIVPLLFLQVAYSKAFYPATILMAWFWMAVIALLIPAYYGAYVYASAMRGGPGAMTSRQRAAGWCSALFFVTIGFLFANALSLTTNTSHWGELWERHSVGGAATGTALNVADPTLWPRWLMMFGFAVVTTAAWTVFDAAFMGSKDSEGYKRWARQTALRLAIAGAAWATLAGTWYVFGTWRPDVYREMFSFPMAALTLVTGAIVWLPPVVLWLVRNKQLSRPLAAAVAIAQVGVLAVNAVSRQFVQNLELRDLFRPGVSAQPVSVDWGPMAMFLLVFVAGLGVLAWMFLQLAKVPPIPLR